MTMLDLLNTYLLPFILAVPLAVLLIVLGLRGGDDDPALRAPPPAAPAAPAAAVPAPPPAAPSGPASVLVIDDSAVARAKLKRLFEGAGYEVEVASDGVEALEALARRRFSVMVTDLEMPRMDGFELIASVQGNLDTEDLPVIAITGHDEMHARVHDIKGLYGLFKKPWNDRELLKRVATLASLPGAAAAAPRPSA